jgi:MFS family permease
VPERYRGLTAGVIKGGGASLAVVVINVIIIGLDAAVGPAAFDAWGWRILFGVALIGSLANYLMLRRIEESPLWRTARAEREKSGDRAYPPHPGRALFSARWRGLVVTSALIVFTASAPYYLTTGILPTVYKAVFRLDQDVASSFVIINVVGSALVAAACGHLSQHVGRRKVFLGAGTACLVLIPGLYALLMLLDAPGTVVVLTSSAVMVMASGAITSPLIIFLNERFPTEIRSTATAFTWNVGYGLSGLAPTFVTGVSASTGAIVPTLIVTSLVVAVVFMILMARSAETRGALAAPS